MNVRLVVACGCCVACGRVDFDALPAAPMPDAAPVSTVWLVSNGATASDPTELMTLDLTDAHLTHVGFIDASLGQPGGLAYWDANTLYAAGNGTVIEITLSPFSATQVATFSGNYCALERDGNDLVALDQVTNELVRFQPPFANATTVTFGAPVFGGDIAMLSSGTWYYYSNSDNRLYSFDPVSGAATAIGAATTPGFVSAIVRDDQDQLYLTTDSNYLLIAIDAATGTLGASLTLCESCPTTYMLGAGDATRTP